MGAKCKWAALKSDSMTFPSESPNWKCPAIEMAVGWWTDKQNED